MPIAPFFNNLDAPAQSQSPVIISSGGGETAFLSFYEGVTDLTEVYATGSTPITYSISGGADNALFTINPNTGLLIFLSAPEYDNPLDSGANNVYEVEVTATNSYGSDSQAIYIVIKQLGVSNTSSMVTALFVLR